MSGNAALGTDQAAYNKNSANADTTLGNFQGTENEYLSNVNSALAAGNPYESKDYLTQQNLETSGAMNAEDAAAKEQEQQTVARTGTNSAALPAEIASQARAGQRDLTNYNATRDTQNEDKWLSQQDKLLSDEQAGANSEANVYGTTQGAANSALGDYTSAANEDQKNKNSIWNGLTQAGGVLGAAAIKAGSGGAG